MRKKYKILLITIVCMLMIGSTIPNVFAIENKEDFKQTKLYNISDGEISVEIPVGEYEITDTKNGQKIKLEDYGHLMIPGQPLLPSKIFAIAIPPGSFFTDVTFNAGKGIELSGKYDIVPSDIPGLIGEDNQEFYRIQQEEYDERYKKIYGSDEPYPESVGEVVRKAGYRNYNLVDVRIMPFTYYPLTGKLVYYPDITVNVKYSFPEGYSYEEVAVDINSDNQKTANRIIVNYEQAKNWYIKNHGSRETYEYIIITLDELTSSVTELQEWEENKGRNVKVVTTDWIDSNYDGYDLAQKMRIFLREKYLVDEWGIQYLCLIGDYDDVPIRTTAQYVGGYGPPATDFYYAELSLSDEDSWDSDGDHQFGENSDLVDFYSEINVGRIPWSDPETVEHICEKSVAYEQNNDPSFKKNILLIGTFFWPDTDNAVLMETKTDPEEHPWMEDWNMTRMYEEAQSSYDCDYDVSYENVKTVWSEGTYAFVDWAGHGSPTACYEYYPSQAFVDTNTCNFLNDDYPAIIFADACSNSDTKHYNIGKMMLKQGGVGFLGATCVAFGYHGWDDPYDGTSQSLDYFFTTCCTSGNYTQGQAQQYGLLECYTYDLWYYTYYEMFQWGALWGNPDLCMSSLNLAPDTPNAPNGPTDGVTEVDFEFSAQTTDPEDNQIYYQFDWGDGNYSDWLGPYDSGDSVHASYSWIEAGEYDIKVIAKDDMGSQSFWSDPLTISIVQAPFVDIRNILGGFFKVNAIIRNLGALDATNVDWSISLSQGAWIGGETQGTISNIPAGDEVTVSSDFIIGYGQTIVTVEASIPENSDSRTQNGALYLIYVKVNPGGN
jgi:hypothetical protein